MSPLGNRVHRRLNRSVNEAQPVWSKNRRGRLLDCVEDRLNKNLGNSTLLWPRTSKIGCVVVAMVAWWWWCRHGIVSIDASELLYRLASWLAMRVRWNAWLHMCVYKTGVGWNKGPFSLKPVYLHQIQHSKVDVSFHPLDSIHCYSQLPSNGCFIYCCCLMEVGEWKIERKVGGE